MLDRWKAQTPFQNEEWFLRRLAMDGLDEQTLLLVISESTENLDHSRVAYSWLSELRAAFTEEEASETCLATREPDGSTSYFLPLIEDLTKRAVKRLHAGSLAIASKYSPPPFEPERIIEIFYETAAKKLSAIISQTSVLELFLAKEQQLVEGATPEDRFYQFIEFIKAPSFRTEILRRYPVLARIIVNWLELWVQTSLEFLTRLSHDWDLIRNTFSPEIEPGPIEKILGGVGDRHCGGRSVLIIRFRSGLNLVYKPKPLSVDIHFSELLEWLNERGAPTLKVPKTLNCGKYGWSEFISTAPCKCRQELEMFYNRQGALLALLYTLQATDFHNENLIASGAHPVLIDLESLFHPSIREPDPTKASSLAEFAMSTSVLRVGLLPQRHWGKDGKEGVDLSGLGGVSDQTSPWAVPLWEKGGTDEMRLTRRQVTIRASSNRPQLDSEKAINPLDFSQSFIEGFETAYKIILNYRDDLTSTNGPLASFANDVVRAILRHTRFYSTILNESYHPELLGNALERDRVFDRLWFGMDKDPMASKMLYLIPSEREDLWNEDIPFFYTRANSCDLWDARGIKIPNFFRLSGMDAVKLRLASLSPEDLEQQKWFIQGSLTTLAMETEPKRKRYHLTESPKISATEKEQSLLGLSMRIGNRLCDLARLGPDEASWIGLKIVANRYWTLAPTGVDLYSGSPGVALFLAYLAEITGITRYNQVSKSAINGVLRQKERLLKHLKSVGAFEGWAGLLYVYTHLAALWDCGEIKKEAEGIVSILAAHAYSDETLDIIGGCAGAIIVLLGFFKISGCKEALNVAEIMGAILLSKSFPSGAGMAWTGSINPERPLTGLSHGASGIAWSLLALYDATRNEDYLNIAVRALAFEKSLFEPKENNWPDLRGLPESATTCSNFMTAWCHGAPGIGLSRLKMLPYYDSPDIRADIRAALRATRERGFGANHSLCHGDLGNMELFLEAQQVFQEETLRSEVENLSLKIISSINEHGFVCGVPLGVETPGLMNGLAGVGYGLLRLAAPDRIPSVLTLALPNACRS